MAEGCGLCLPCASLLSFPCWFLYWAKVETSDESSDDDDDGDSMFLA